MVNYIGNMLNDTLEDTRGEPKTPDAHYLFYIAEDTTKISQTNTEKFHRFVAQILHL